MAKDYPNYFVGLDIGTNSVGIAACDTEYNLLRFKGNFMWSSMVFDEANSAEERRTFRTARRRNNRTKQRIHRLQELMAPAVLPVDPDFFVRVKESELWADDKTTGSKSNYFNDKNYKDKDYYKQYPTIHHLICELIDNPSPHDPRLVYIAVSYILSHRGHFLNPANKDNIDEVLDINSVFKELKDWFEITRETDFPFDCMPEDFGKVLVENKGVKNRLKIFKNLLSNGKKIKTDDNSPVDPDSLLNMISGGTTSVSELFMNDSYSEIEKIDISSANFDEREDELRTELGDDFGLIAAAKNLYDWSLLSNLLDDKFCISQAKVDIYEEHKHDLKILRDVVRKYIPQYYDEIFRTADNKIDNYTKYSGNLSSVKQIENLGNVAVFKTCNQAEFCAYLKKKFKGIESDNDQELQEVISKIENNSLCPLQVNSDNRTIPYQLYYDELKKILRNAENYIPELRVSDEYGSVSDKILSIMTFKIPYYVGPLDKSNSPNAWIVKKSKDKIYPWNFDDIVDHEKSENEFIRRMTCKCSYLAGEDVLPKNSLLYTKYVVLNEINTITINGQRLPARAKQDLYNEVFMQRKKISLKMIKNHLIANGVMKGDDILRGIDENVKSTLKPWIDFRKLMTNGTLTEEQVEEIILRITCTTDRTRLYNWLRGTMKLTEEDAKYVCALKYSDFGRLSKQLLTEVLDVNPVTGEIIHPNIITMMWENSLNLMEILAQKYNYTNEIERRNRVYYGNSESLSFNERMDEMYISNSVRRPIKRSMEMLREVVKICGKPPKRIFIEMARELTDPQKKGKRTSSRRQKIEEYFKKFPAEEISKIRQELESVTNEQLQSDKLYLYFMQLGKCMYSGKGITIGDLDKKNADGKYLYDIDHIFPQSKVKDDSIENRVLVLSAINGNKKDDYPISAEIRNEMYSFWKKLHDNKLIGDKKFERLTRSVPFSDEELSGFINRQLVETRQSAKAVVELIKQEFPESEIVYVKAGLTSQFRQENNIVKCRDINDLHHAKDAYLNIVMGNIYHVKFTKNPMMFVKEYRDKKAVYDLKIKSILEHDVIRNGETAWKGDGSSLATVMNCVSKNNIRYVVYTYRRKGQLFNANPERNIKGDVLVPRKKGLPSEKYGGHNNAGASFFVFVKFDVGKKTYRAILPVELMYAEKFEHDKEFAKQYIEQAISKIFNLKAERIEFPLGKRIIKVGTMIDIDGYRACIKAKISNGRQLSLSQGVSLMLNPNIEEYIKRLSSVYKKIDDLENKKEKYVIDEKYDKINADDNLSLYDILTAKSEQKPYSNNNTLKGIGAKLKDGRACFEKLSLNDQVKVLMSVVEIFKTGRTHGCNLELIGDKKSVAVITLNSTVSNAKGINSIRIVDQSPTGLYETISPNLLNL